jgi:catechol 2,3-dioxygenase-like lactoylglutathione lyase family enzyme
MMGVAVRRAAPALLLALALAGASGARAAEIVRVRYIVTDVPASIAFYRDAMGFKVDFQSGPYFAALSRGGVQLLLSPAKGPGGASQPMPTGERPAPGLGWNRLVINTPDLPAEVARLRKAGVHFRNEIVYGLGGNEILLDDPSGNVIELFQPTTDVTAR